MQVQDVQPANRYSTGYSAKKFEPTITKLLNASWARSTIKQYDHHLNVLAIFVKYNLNINCEFPIHQDIIGAFIAHLFDLGHAHATILTYMSAISAYHKLRNFPDPCDSFYVTKLLKGVQKLKPIEKALRPINKSKLHEMIDVLKWIFHDDFNIILYKAILLFMYYGCFRVGEALSSGTLSNNTIQRQNIQKVWENGKVDCFLIHMTSYKHHYNDGSVLKMSRAKYPEFCPVQALLNYIKISPGSTGNLFKNVLGSEITRNDLVKVIKQSLELLRIEPSLFNSHSLRIGRTTDLALAGVSVEKIKMVGRWSSNAYLKYIRPSEVKLPVC